MAINLTNKKYKAFVLPAKQSGYDEKSEYVKCFLRIEDEESMVFYAKPLTRIPKYKELVEYVHGRLESILTHRETQVSTGYNVIYLDEEGKLKKDPIANIDATAFSMLSANLMKGGDILVGDVVFVREGNDWKKEVSTKRKRGGKSGE